MNPIKCIIVDDEELARELIESYLAQLDGFELVASCPSAIQANSVLKEHTIDLMFLDIEMPVLKGTDFYKNLIQKPKVIFTTAYRDYALDGFELDAVDYLLKPIVFSRFFQAIERFQSSLNVAKVESVLVNDNHKKHIFVRKDRKQVKLFLEDICYVQGLKDYVQIFTVNDSHIIKHSVTKLLEELGSSFIRVHRSYLVNAEKVSAVSSHDIEIGEIEIPIGSHYKDAINQLIK
jgi:DNA-binding LytR/AlgR family response regulator